MFPKLFEAGRIGNLEVKNRIVKSPQTTALSTFDGAVTERLVNHYKRLAEGGAGLVMVEYTYIDDDASKSIHCQLGISSREHIAGLGWLVDEVHAAGARIGIQLEHCGRQKFLGTQPIKAPSVVPWDLIVEQTGEVPQELTVEEIRGIVRSFGDAASRAVLAGFDIVEVHGGHGYLITNFLSPHTNKRTDEYGDSAENRRRFLLEVVADIRAKIPQDFPLSVRLSVTDYEEDGIPVEETIELCKLLEEAGVDVIHASGGHHARMEWEVSPYLMPLAPHLWAIERIKSAVCIPVMASGSIVRPRVAERILAEGKADFVSLGRPLLADPDWPRKAEAGRPEDIVPCIRCNDGCLHRGLNAGRSVGCTVNPSVAHEYAFDVRPARQRRNVAVVGGGPAGIKAALTLVQRGHAVTLFERRKLGGKLWEATAAPFKQDLALLRDHLVTQVHKHPIQVIERDATAEDLMDGGFDLIVVATGARRRRWDTPGADAERVVHALEAQPAGGQVAVVGGGFTGTETALRLADAGSAVTLIEAGPQILSGDVFTDQMVYPARLKSAGVRVLTQTKALEVADGSVLVTSRDGSSEQLSANSIVVAVGYDPDTSLADELRRRGHGEVIVVGDASRPGKVLDALHGGFSATRLC